MKFRNITGEGMQMCLKGLFCISSATHDVQWLNCVTVSCKIEVSHEKVAQFLFLKSKKKTGGPIIRDPRVYRLLFGFK